MWCPHGGGQRGGQVVVHETGSVRFGTSFSVGRLRCGLGVEQVNINCPLTFGDI